MDKNIDITVDNMSVFAPVIAAQLTSAWYSALLLKKESGKEITVELREKTIQDVLEIWAALLASISEVLKKTGQPVGEHQQGQP